MDDILGRLAPADQQLVDDAYETLGRIRRVTVRLRASWLRMDDLSPQDESSLKSCLQKALDAWAGGHGVELKTDGPSVEVRKADAYLHLDL